MGIYPTFNHLACRVKLTKNVTRSMTQINLATTVRIVDRTKMFPCPFCQLPDHRVVMRNSLAAAFFDAYPVAKGHALVVPVRHVEDVWGLTAEERQACHELLEGLRRFIRLDDASVSGFNLGTNAGASAGQTVFHCHFHLIPRREGDCANPRGGVRHVFPEKANYDPSAPELPI